MLAGAGGDPDPEVALKAAAGDLLALRTGSGQVVYPAFRFVGDRPIDGLGLVLAALPEALVSGWTVASWLLSPSGAHGGSNPMAMLRQGSTETVVRSAAHWAEALGA